jgi:hypothetical protein
VQVGLRAGPVIKNYKITIKKSNLSRRMSKIHLERIMSDPKKMTALVIPILVIYLRTYFRYFCGSTRYYLVFRWQLKLFDLTPKKRSNIYLIILDQERGIHNA